MNGNGIQRSVFVVGTESKKARPWCVWEWDLRDRNLRFLERLDHEYFEYVIRRHIDKLEGDDARRAAVAIRVTYHHALETLFTLLAAAVQAPDCVVAWVPKCKTDSLRELVIAISRHGRIPNKLGLDHVSWDAIAEKVFTPVADAEARDRMRTRFARLWARLAHQFLNQKAINEYNSLKHGFRVRPGGFSLAVGRESSPGVLAPGEVMKSMGGSNYG